MLVKLTPSNFFQSESIVRQREVRQIKSSKVESQKNASTTPFSNIVIILAFQMEPEWNANFRQKNTRNRNGEII